MTKVQKLWLTGFFLALTFTVGLYSDAHRMPWLRAGTLVVALGLAIYGSRTTFGPPKYEIPQDEIDAVDRMWKKRVEEGKADG